jgi:hypothetical protein
MEKETLVQSAHFSHTHRRKLAGTGGHPSELLGKQGFAFDAAYRLHQCKNVATVIPAQVHAYPAQDWGPDYRQGVHEAVEKETPLLGAHFSFTHRRRPSS